MHELSWPQRGRLWLRLGLRLVFFALLLWAAIRLCPPLLSLFSPFLLAMVVVDLLCVFVPQMITLLPAMM